MKAFLATLAVGSVAAAAIALAPAPTPAAPKAPQSLGYVVAEAPLSDEIVIVAPRPKTAAVEEGAVAAKPAA